MVSRSTKNHIKGLTVLDVPITVARSKPLLSSLLSSSEMQDISMLLTAAAPEARHNKAKYGSFSGSIAHEVALPHFQQPRAWSYLYKIKKPFAKKDPNIKRVTKLLREKLDSINLSSIEIEYKIKVQSVGYGYSRNEYDATHIGFDLKGRVPATLEEITSKKAAANYARKQFLRDRDEIDKQLDILNKFLGPNE